MEQVVFIKSSSNCDQNDGREMKFENLQIHLMGHCIICLRDVSTKRARSTSDHLKRSYHGSGAQTEVASKSLVSTSEFLTTFNQVWTVLQSKWKKKNAPTKDDGSFKEIRISLENVLQAALGSTNVTFSSAPTICQLCYDKVLAVENLMKALRQQVRELNMLLEDGRPREDGGIGDFEKRLRENGLEESVIRATLQFVGIFGGGSSEDDLQDKKGDDDIAAVVGSRAAHYDDGNGWAASDDDENEGQAISSDEDGDPDYVKEEPEDAENGEEGDDESEEEMEVDEKEAEKDPLALFPVTRKENSVGRRGKNQNGSDGQKEGNNVDKKFLCGCGKSFGNKETLRSHFYRTRRKRPDCKCKLMGRPLGNRQTCDLCGQRLMDSDMLEHLTGHLNGQAEWVMRCPNKKCRFLCVTNNAFNKHTHRVKTNECTRIWREKCGPVCDICGFKGTNMFKIRNHVRDNHEKGKEKKWGCPISGCGKMFFIKQSIKYHLDEHRIRPIPEQICDKCGKDLKIEEMEGHLKEEHGIEEVIGCGQCEMKFSGRDEMVEHLYEHRRIGIHCDICGEDKFGRYVDFREHYFGIHKLCPKKYKCGEGENCKAWFWRKETRKDHELNMHKQIKKEKVQKVTLKVRCDMCDFECVKEESLIKHKISVHGDDPFGCDTCGMTFDDKRTFLKHKKKHTGTIPVQNEWKCEVEGCGKIFEKRSHWKYHEKICHGGERRHVCEICGKGFSLEHGLKKHRDSVHLGLRPWVCEECGEGFVSSSVLKKHKLIHTGERPFGCDICGQRFRHRDVLRRHLIGHEEKGTGFKPNGPMKQIRKRKAQ